MGIFSDITSGGLIGGIGDFFGKRAMKKQTKQILRDYNDAETNSLAGFTGARDASLQAYTGARDASLGYYEPFRAGGTTQFEAAQNMLTPGFKYDPSDPAYAFRRSEMEGALARKQAAGGGYRSGGADKALARYAGDLSNTYFQQDFANRNALAQYGLQGAQGMSGAQGNYAQGAAGAHDNYARGVYDTEFSAARGRHNARLKRGEAIAGQWGAGADIAQALASIFAPAPGGG